MKSTFCVILSVLFCHVLAFSAAAQSMAEKWKAEIFNPESNLQRQLEEQQSAHDKNKDIIAMVSVYSDPKNTNLTIGYSVGVTGIYKEFMHGPMRSIDTDAYHWPFHLPLKAVENLKTLLAQLPAPKDPNPKKRWVIISFLDGEKWVTRIYGDTEQRDILQAILRLPSQNDPQYGDFSRLAP